jgi:hypothetical protein
MLLLLSGRFLNTAFKKYIMKKIQLKNLLLPSLFGLLLVFWFKSSFLTFFSQDDFFRFKMSQANTFSQVVGFFGFKNSHLYGFYRPISINLYSYLGPKIFGLNPFYYHAFNFAIFCSTIWLIYRIATKLLGDRKKALYAAVFYGFSASHLTALSYLPNVEEVIVAFFYFLTIFLYLKGSKFSLLTFVLALLSRETAVTLPFVLVGLEFFQHKKWIRALPFFLLLVVYVFLRYFFHLFPDQSVYQTTFALSKILNNGVWFFTWALGFPESLVDFIGPGIKLNPSLFKISPPLPYLIIGLGLIFTFWFGLHTLLFFLKEKQRGKVVAFCLWFGVTLLPFLPLSGHKFAYYLEIPLFGVACLMALVLTSSKVKTFVGVGFYILLAFLTIRYYEQTYWGINRPKLTQALFAELKAKYPVLPKGATLYFKNDPGYKFVSEDWGGTSTQARHALSECNGPQFLYNDFSLKCLFEDDNPVLPETSYSLMVEIN